MPRDIVKKEKRKIAGELRRSQILTTFGCGAIVDFPRLSGIMAGIDKWTIQQLPESAKIHERNLELLLGKDFFYQVSSPENALSETFMLPTYRFPAWYYCPECHRLDTYNKIAKSVSGNNSDYNASLVCNECSDSSKQVKLVPSRFVVACLNGHISEFPYIWWTHRRHGTCDKPRLMLEYKGSTGGLDSIVLTCENCKATATMAGCMDKEALTGFRCKRDMPWLGFDEKQWYKDPMECLATPRVLQRSANNVYYSVNKSALTIPPWSERLQELLASKDTLFQDIFDEEDEDETVRRLKKEFNKHPEFYGNDEKAFIDAAFFRYGNREEEVNEKSLRMDEYRAFCGQDVDDEQFRTETVEVPPVVAEYVDQIKLIKKLREVMVLQGFRRILPAEITDEEERKELGLSNQLFSPISRQPMNWLPAIELFGEGIFIRLNEKKVLEWEQVNCKRYLDMGKRHERAKWIGNEMFDASKPRFVLLHTLSHLLIKQLTSQCGYATASIKEKIYSSFVDEGVEMCGILIYTSATDTDGSLGGLVREGYTDRLSTTFENMLQESSWCSNDPLCIESTSQGYMGLNYSACHACALLPETSCEAMNCLLDRAAVVGTPDNKGMAYFKGIV